jgi:hypothetical protein
MEDAMRRRHGAAVSGVWFDEEGHPCGMVEYYAVSDEFSRYVGLRIPGRGGPMLTPDAADELARQLVEAAAAARKGEP